MNAKKHLPSLKQEFFGLQEMLRTHLEAVELDQNLLPDFLLALQLARTTTDAADDNAVLDVNRASSLTAVSSRNDSGSLVEIAKRAASSAPT